MESADMEAHLLGEAKQTKEGAWNLRNTFAMPMITLIACTFGLFAFLTEFEHKEYDMERYNLLIHVLLMIFVGFGFLMTFLRSYSSSAVGLNFLLSGLVMLLSMLAVGTLQQGLLTGAASIIKIDLPLIIDSAFCAGAAMIAFGAVLGRASPGQLLGLLVLLVPVYAANAWLVTEVLEVIDIGGSITIHAFGAYYGLAASRFLFVPSGGAGHPKNGATAATDITAMIGTIFLWVLWPSFNGALAKAPGESDVLQFYCAVNTVVALLGAVVAAFAASAAITNKFDMVHVQNATLAGGVAIGTSASLHLPPAAALAVGLLSGTWSVVGYVFVSPLVEKYLGVQDTCGVHNLHGMPGVLGGLFTAVFTAIPAIAAANEGQLPHGAGAQPLWQLAGLGITLLVALVSGAAAGAAASAINPGGQMVPLEMLYDDALFWHQEGGEEHED